MKSITFDKKNFNLKECEKWLIDHDYQTYELIRSNNPREYEFLASRKLQGAGIWDELVRKYKGLKMAISGVRTNLKPGTRKIISENQGANIININVSRKPLGSTYNNMLKILKNSNAKQPDQLYHLFMICKLSNGNTLRVEKNEEVNIIPYVPSDIEEIEPINQSINIPVQEFLDKAKEYMGEHDFNTYSALKTNCQDFVLRTLKANGIHVSNELHDFIVQDVKDLLPEWSERLAFFLTSTSNRVKTAVEGFGYKKGGLIWGLTPDQQKRYIEDSKTGKNLKKVGSMTVWDDPYHSKYL